MDVKKGVSGDFLRNGGFRGCSGNDGIAPSKYEGGHPKKPGGRQDAGATKMAARALQMQEARGAPLDAEN